MENLKRAGDLLLAVLGDMDRIPVTGIDNQRAYLSCADGIETVRRVILQHVATEEAKTAQEPKPNDAEVSADG